MEKQTPQELIDKYLMGKATPEEKATLESWYLMRSENMKDMLPEPDYVELENEIWPVIDEQTLPGKKQVKLWPRIIGVAAAVALIVLGVYFFNAPRHPEFISGSPLANDIAPGKNTAIITLIDGTVIPLSDAQTGVVVGNDKLAYSDGSSVNGRHPELVSGSPHSLLTASTPRGGTYQVILPDGTHVWLNADSKISFPAQFSGGIRKILLSGEAYFEVAKDKAHPFVVQTDKQEVTVLGTHFNINSYNDEINVKTTLLEGSVSVTPLSAMGRDVARDREVKGKSSTLSGLHPSLPEGENRIILKPNQQSVLSGSNRIVVANVDVSEAVAWKEGNFVFRAQPLENIMRNVARWYDVEVVYADHAPKDVPLSGIVSRAKNISVVLERMEATGSVKFKVEGKKVIVLGR
jgi:transmembrane sensor